MNIIQNVSTPPGGESFLDIQPVQPGSTLIVCADVNAMSLPNGRIAAEWDNTTSNDATRPIRQVCIGHGPFTSETRLQLTPGRTPPKVNATLLEVAP